MGVLSDGKVVAVKRMIRPSTNAAEQLKNEMLVLANLQHRNLVRILGVCFEGNEPILIYEYVARGSLDGILFDPVKKEVLDWKTRYRIIKGIARGLQYLHEESQINAIHRDLKASNILLDEQLDPKISDFGTARLFGHDQTQATTNIVVGTLGYMPPEYFARGQFSRKTDVYSFGVLVLEIVTGRRNRPTHTSESKNSTMSLLDFVWNHWSSGSKLDALDDSLIQNCQEDEVELCIHTALLCVEIQPANRPTMPSVVLMLNRDESRLRAPTQPAFVGNYMGTTSSTSHVRTSSVEETANGETN